MSCPDPRIRRWGLAAAAGLAALAVTGVAAAQSMVIRSTGPSAAKYPTGTKLKAGDKVTLVAGDRLILMQDGKTRSLSGPGNFATGGTIQASQSVGATVTRMLAKGPTMRARGGFSRGPDESMPAELRAPNLWLLDYREAGTFCVADPMTLLLWRPHMDSDQLLKIEQGDRSETVAIVSGANFRRWPTDLVPIQFGVDYRLSGAGLPASVTVRFAAIESLPETVEASVETLLVKGCSAQLDRLVDAVSETGGG